MQQRGSSGNLDDLMQLVIIWLAVFVSVVVSKYSRLTPVLFFLAAGSILVNLGALHSESQGFVVGLSEVGIIVIMFALGFEENSAKFIRSVKRSWGIAFFGALAPFLGAYFVADYFWNDQNISLMCGLTMTATAVSLTMVSLRSEGLATTPAATRIMTSAVLDDIASLALVAILVPIATGDHVVGVGETLMVVGKAILFFLVVSILGIWVFPHDLSGWIARIPILGRYGVRSFLSFNDGEYSTLIVLLLAVGVGLIAHEFGFHPAVGAYMAGLILKEEYFRNVRSESGATNNFYLRTKEIIDNAAFAWIGPIFFVELGTKLVFDWDIFVAVIPHTLAMTLTIFLVQIISAALAARYTGGLKNAASIMVGLGMLGRAELAFVVLDIAYVENAILSTEAFYTLMFSAFWLNVAVPIGIRFWKPYYERELSRKKPASISVQS